MNKKKKKSVWEIFNGFENGFEHIITSVPFETLTDKLLKRFPIVIKIHGKYLASNSLLTLNLKIEG